MRRTCVAILALGCGPAIPSPGGVDPATTTSTGAATSSESTMHDDEGTSDAVIDSRDWPASFIADTEGNGQVECSVFAQDCPAGEKCTPWAADGPAFNKTRCIPVEPDPKQPGQTCTVEITGLGPIDDCEAASMCWFLDPETDVGTCVPLCIGSENNPICLHPEHACSLNAEGILNLCLPICDPLAQDCGEGEGCWGVHDDFVCAPDASGDAGAFGDPCEALNACDPRLECVRADAVPGCSGAVGCCSPQCDRTEPDECPAGLMCVSWFERGQSPPGYEDVGVCLVPE